MSSRSLSKSLFDPPKGENLLKGWKIEEELTGGTRGVYKDVRDCLTYSIKIYNKSSTILPFFEREVAEKMKVVEVPIEYKGIQGNAWYFEGQLELYQDYIDSISDQLKK